MQNPIATISTRSGKEMVIELYPDIAPNTVNNFISLANSKFYDGLFFHRVIKGFMIQGGCPKGTGMGGPGYCIKGEFAQNGVPNSLKHQRGVISMARAADPNRAGSKLFIMHQDAPHLDGAYATFGKVISGFDALDEIANCLTDRMDRPYEKQLIRSIRVNTFGKVYPEPVKM